MVVVINCYAFVLHLELVILKALSSFVGKIRRKLEIMYKVMDPVVLVDPQIQQLQARPALQNAVLKFRKLLVLLAGSAAKRF